MYPFSKNHVFEVDGGKVPYFDLCPFSNRRTTDRGIPA
jgi:hypothetical protein